MSVFNLLLVVHVMGGAVALLAGPVPMLSRKGGRLHRRSGRLFAVALGAGSVSAFALALMTGDRLLLTIAVLTAFLIVTGVRAAQFRQRLPPAGGDWAICLVLAVFGVWLIGSGLADVTGVFFGVGCLLLAGRQWQLLRSPRADWLLAHIAGMGGAYTATATAFLVVNLGFLPKAAVFIVPTLIGTAFITWASVRHRARGVTVAA